MSDQDAADLAAAIRKGEEDQNGQEDNKKTEKGNGKGEGASKKKCKEGTGRAGTDGREGGGGSQQDSSKPRIRVATGKLAFLDESFFFNLQDTHMLKVP